MPVPTQTTPRSRLRVGAGQATHRRRNLMAPTRTQLGWLTGLIGMVVVGGAAFHWSRTGPIARANALDDAEAKSESADVSGPARVAVVKPQKGTLGRATTQPGTVESFDFADLYAKVSGYL